MQMFPMNNGEPATELQMEFPNHLIDHVWTKPSRQALKDEQMRRERGRYAAMQRDPSDHRDDMADQRVPSGND